ncbi:pantoate--beta-alanine ligase [Rhabdobacter roseus]|uniref:Pantothenate synthetase n=1 Tax=Rhabdobacter roseus TaxID=1655419 RepID=A0A840TRJ0_9BACT|nr:pantoate--beta-alanine ligase [Rhabdobacter roseus]MBB5284337.1 pantoate--beta-alanine ligase [Rhabdobacter roseus]
MQLFKVSSDLRVYLAAARRERKTIGFVPTMGALHEGHLSLIEASRRANDLTVCSIFVNPIQFNNPEDLEKYPRTLDNDRALLEAAGCDVVFAPSAAEMYPTPPVLSLGFGALETVMEGTFRPGHFNGVGLVVARLFHLVQPDRAYFGQKDLQQVAVVRRLVQDLAFPIEVVSCPTLREADGLAMSSRNRRLSPEQRGQASLLSEVLQQAKNSFLNGHSVEDVKAHLRNRLAAFPNFNLEYFEIVHAQTLQPVTEEQEPGATALCVAAYLGPVRLIDNLVF